VLGGKITTQGARHFKDNYYSIDRRIMLKANSLKESIRCILLVARGS